MTRFIYIALFISLSTFAQSGKEFPLTKDSDTTYWKYRSKGNIDLRSSSVDLAFRLETSCNILEIRKSGSSFYGEISFFVCEVDKVQTGKSFKQFFPLDNEIVREMFELIDSTAVTKIPSDQFIKGWQQGFDGINYTFEYKTLDSYSYKSYWMPRVQENVPEALSIQKFVDRLYDLASSNTKYKTFEKNIPYLSWTCGGTIVARILSREEYREYKRKKKRENKTAANSGFAQ